MKKILIITILFLTNCGYKPLLINNTSPDLIFSEISTFGNKKINRNVISLLKIQENKNDLSFNKLILKNEKNNIEILKDSKVRINTYRLIIKLEFSIDNNKGKVEKKSFEESFTYNNKSNKSDLVQYQREIEENLINKIIEELTIYLSLR